MRRAFRNESGIALVVAIGVLGVLSIVSASLMYYVNSNSRSAAHSAHGAGAYHLAEAGMNYARSILFNASDFTDPASVGSGSVAFEGGTAAYSGTLSGTVWTLVGIGTMPNPTGGAPITRTVSSQVEIVNGAGPAWNYNYSDSLTGCLKIENEVVLSAPLYVRGDLCLEDEVRVTGSPLHVGGTLSLSDEASVGTATDPIASANIVEGCTGGTPDPHPCTAADRVYAQTITQTPGTLTKPPVDLVYWYQNASPGPLHPCTIGSMPGGFDSGATGTAVPPNPDRSRPTFYLTPGSAYDCRTPEGQIRWTPGNPGTLTLAGTIFIDGEIEIGEGAYAVYSGKATIYASGKIRLIEDARICGVAACDGTWDLNTNYLVFVAGHPSATDAFKLEQGAIYQGGAYVVADYKAENSAVNWGPVIANQLKIENNVGQTFLPNLLPPGAPGSATTLANVSGSFTST